METYPSLKLQESNKSLTLSIVRENYFSHFFKVLDLIQIMNYL